MKSSRDTRIKSSFRLKISHPLMDAQWHLDYLKRSIAKFDKDVPVTCMYCEQLRKDLRYAVHIIQSLIESSPKENKMIGLSLSFCVRDILVGKVKEKDVTKILSGTRARYEGNWEDIFKRYKGIYWRNAPEEGEKIAKRLLEAGKVEQTRLTQGKVANLANGQHWVKDENQIVWEECD